LVQNLRDGCGASNRTISAVFGALGVRRVAVAGRHVAFRGDDNTIAVLGLAGNGDARAPPLDHADDQIPD
jgi:hypothetical protein